MANITTAAAHTALNARLLANLPSGYTSAKVKLTNRSFITPSNSKWLRPTVIIQDSKINGADGNCEISEGLFVVDMFFPLGEDVTPYRIEAEEIKGLFKAQSFNDVSCQSVTISDNPDENYFSIQITIEFFYESA